jgi:hypothetical protein
MATRYFGIQNSDGSSVLARIEDSTDILSTEWINFDVLGSGLGISVVGYW